MSNTALNVRASEDVGEPWNDAEEQEAELLLLAYDVVVAKINYEEAVTAYAKAMAHAKELVTRN